MCYRVGGMLNNSSVSVLPMLLGSTTVQLLVDMATLGGIISFFGDNCSNVCSILDLVKLACVARYQFMPDLLQPPNGANFQNCHGLALDKDNNIILTYQPAGKV